MSFGQRPVSEILSITRVTRPSVDESMWMMCAIQTCHHSDIDFQLSEWGHGLPVDVMVRSLSNGNTTTKKGCFRHWLIEIFNSLENYTISDVVYNADAQVVCIHRRRLRPGQDLGIGKEGFAPLNALTAPPNMMACKNHTFQRRRTITTNYNCHTHSTKSTPFHH